MRNEKIYYWLLQFSGWTLFHVMVGANAYSQDKFSQKYFIVIVLLWSMAIIVSHSMRAIFIRFKWLNFNIFKLIPRVISVSFLGAVVIYTSQFISGSFYYSNVIELLKKPLLDHFTSILSWWIMLIIWSSIYLAYHFFNKSKKEEIENLKLKASQNEIMLNQLRSQLNPHFIFNALNSIRALISENPEHAKKAIQQLSVILRSSLNYNKQKTITIKDELLTVIAYLTLEKIRFEERLSYAYSCSHEAENAQIPPLMLQTIVENAVKHGISKMAKGGEILIEISTVEDNVLILVKNSGELSNINRFENTGIGIENTKKRLELLFGENFTWQLRQTENYVEAKIKYPKALK